MFSRAPEVSSEPIGRAPVAAPAWRSWQYYAVLLISIGAFTFDALTPQIVSVGMFYAGLVLASFWLPKPRASFVLASIATVLIIAGNWITIPDNTPPWEAWLNRALAIGTVWIAAEFVFYIRVLKDKLQQHIELAEVLAHELNHRVGNQLQALSSFLRLRSRNSNDAGVRQALELAASRIVVIGTIQRALSHSQSPRTVESKQFFSEIRDEVCSALVDPNRIRITLCADSANLSPSTALALGAVLFELINNALKHAFPDSMSGSLTINFAAADGRYVTDFNDDGVGMSPNVHKGFGSRNVADLVRLMKGSMTCRPLCPSSSRPGTAWRLVVPA